MENIDSLDGNRRRGLLEAALVLFARYGYRKTSMEEVARAGGISRQGLYLHFPAKEDLFRATVFHALECGLVLVAAVTADKSLKPARLLLRIYDEWIGRYVGMLGAGASDLIDAAKSLLHEIIAGCESRFLDMAARSIEETPLAPYYRKAGIEPRVLAWQLLMTSIGVKERSATRADFTREMTTVIRILCAGVPDCGTAAE